MSAFLSHFVVHSLSLNQPPNALPSAVNTGSCSAVSFAPYGTETAFGARPMPFVSYDTVNKDGESEQLIAVNKTAAVKKKKTYFFIE